jgi:AcrR family transcriptional regulator
MRFDLPFRRNDNRQCDSGRMPTGQRSTGNPRPEPADALRLARRRFRQAERVDMTALADELGINRVTLYRWVGSRDSLLVEVLWSLADRVLRWSADQPSRHTGGEWIVDVVTRFLDRVIADPGMQRFLVDEGELAMRLLTRADHHFQPRLTGAVHDLLLTEAKRGNLDLRADLGEVAFAIVRIIESYTYLDLILGEKPSAERAEPIFRLLLC